MMSSMCRFELMDFVSWTRMFKKARSKNNYERRARNAPRTISTIIQVWAVLTLCVVLKSQAFIGKYPYFGAFKKAAFIDRQSTQQSLHTSDYRTTHLPRRRKPENASVSTVSPHMEENLSSKRSSPHCSNNTQAKQKYNLTLVLIDHYDSFTYNLYDMLAQLCDSPPIVLAKDAFDDWSDVIDAFGGDDSTIDGVVLSPGPGTPTNPNDIGSLSPSTIAQNPDLPILGVCLGHQIMGHYYGARVDLCSPVHGQVRTIERSDCDENTPARDPLWEDIPSQLDVTRYHSLAVTIPENDKSVPLRPTAYTKEDNSDDRVLMAMSHKDNPHYGVQFHPESIGSQHGLQLLRNFCDVSQRLKWKNQENEARLKWEKRQNEASFSRQGKMQLCGQDRETVEKVWNNRDVQAHRNKQAVSRQATKSKAQVFVHKVMNTGLSTQQVFDEFLSNESYSVWLDTSVGVQSTTSNDGISYCSILGAGYSPIEYFGKDYPEEQQGLFQYSSTSESKIRLPEDDILMYLHKAYSSATDSICMVSFHDNKKHTTTTFTEDGDILPFDFRGGHVGYLGYEVRHDSQRFLEEQEQGMHSKGAPFSFKSTNDPSYDCSPNENSDLMPTSAFIFLERSWVYDHSSGDWYLISVVEDPADEAGIAEAIKWMKLTAAQMEQKSPNGAKVTLDELSQSSRKDVRSSSIDSHSDSHPVKFSPNRSRERYNQNFEDCQEQIRLGESYELCLTNQLEAHVSVPSAAKPLALYKVLRQRNPAPFSAFMSWNADRREKSSSLAICCSSPERFVSVRRKRLASSSGKQGSMHSIKFEVEAKPIKGTCARVLPKNAAEGLTYAEKSEDTRRALELKMSTKNRAENLMIVDLLRNDLSRVCESGSVHVSKLMDIESYATVHQMVSTIRGTLDPSYANAVDILKATFPGGSMTGAPKIRTMEIIDQLEEGVSRGPYSGCLGYISMNGSMDMNIVIRTAVLTPNSKSTRDKQDGWKISIGAGGAITALSESKDEYEEMRLKASAVIQAVQEWVSSSQDISDNSLHL